MARNVEHRMPNAEHRMPNHLPPLRTLAFGVCPQGVSFRFKALACPNTRTRVSERLGVVLQGVCKASVQSMQKHFSVLRALSARLGVKIGLVARGGGQTTSHLPAPCVAGRACIVLPAARGFVVSLWRLGAAPEPELLA